MKKQSSEVRTSTCAFVYSDGRQCRSLPRYKSLYCLHHERKLHHLREADWTTSHISEHVTHNFVSASALNRSLGRLFAAIADGSIPPKAATQLVNLLKSCCRPAMPPLANCSWLILKASTWNTSSAKLMTTLPWPNSTNLNPTSLTHPILPPNSMPSRSKSNRSQDGPNLFRMRTYKTWPCNPFAVRTYISLSKQMTYNVFGIRTYSTEFQ